MSPGTRENPIRLADLSPEDVPAGLRTENLFDFGSHPFEHAALFDGIKSVIDILGKTIGNYAQAWLDGTINEARDSAGVVIADDTCGNGQSSGSFRVITGTGTIYEPAFVRGVTGKDKPFSLYVAEGARIEGANIFLDEGDIYVGPGTIVEPGTAIKGPSIIGPDNELRFGAYLRGNVIIGRGGEDCAFRGEMKNVVMMDNVNFPHPSYLGDSICGYNTHFGNQATAANLGIFQGLRAPEKRKNIVMKIGGIFYDIGLVKMGVIMGDNTQIGCNSVLAPGTVLGRDCVAYALTCFERGAYPPSTLFKNKPVTTPDGIELFDVLPMDDD
ncbi:hypothetical protein ACFL47_04475 [Candidatus Latescibacterota bacterium]